MRRTVAMEELNRKRASMPRSLIGSKTPWEYAWDKGQQLQAAFVLLVVRHTALFNYSIRYYTFHWSLYSPRREM